MLTHFEAMIEIYCRRRRMSIPKKKIFAASRRIDYYSGVRAIATLSAYRFAHDYLPSSNFSNLESVLYIEEVDGPHVAGLWKLTLAGPAETFCDLRDSTVEYWLAEAESAFSAEVILAPKSKMQKKIL
uniref:Uncharacterized protein n=1 Tax=Romanomermis culicivorax TaxID=13658 RepID=A0A915KRP6_ROMCU